MTETIPLRRLVLYKHGVGYYTRQGSVSGQEVALELRGAEVDDALKSLTAFTLDGGQVTGIHYQTPEKREERFSQIPLRLGKKHSLFDLLRDVRGTPVTLRLEGSRTVSGRVVGVEEHPQGRKGGAMVVLAHGSAVEQIASDRITQIQLEDERVAADLHRYLEASRSEETRRTIRITLSEPGRQVQLSYTVPSPVWRVSYRLVGETDGSVGQFCLLQGWGIFDNRLEEDLEDVEVALVAGQPVSFRYDLTSSVIPERAFVPDEARVAAGPVEFEADYRGPAVPAGPAEFRPFEAAEMRSTARPMYARAARAMPPQELGGSTLMATEGREMDELFEYRVGGVSVKRGESAMVPVAQHTSPYRRELLYNGAKQPRHPVASLRLRNETGLTLERGPVTIVEDGQYRGEAILPFTRAVGEIVLAYAVELGVTVVEESKEWNTSAGLDLRGAYVHVQEHRNRRTTYTLTNATSAEQIVTIERARWGEAELTDTPRPNEETAEHRRWRVVCAPQARTTFVVTERVLAGWQEAVLDQNLEALSRYLENRSLDAATRRGLEVILRLRQRVADIDTHLERLEQEQEALGNRQERLRENLTIEAINEQEAEIRRRSADEFRRTQDREEEIVAEIERLRAEREQVEAELQNELARLG